MKFSVLIAHYNNFEYFKDCYKSLLEQTFKDFEIVILDDCSTNGDLEKVTEYTKNDARVKIFKNEENRGVGFTKRRLAELASGEICGLLDPDDALATDAIETVLSAYEKNPNIVGTYSLIMLCDENLKPKKLFKEKITIKNGDKFFFNINFEINHFFTFKKSEYLKTEGINPNLTIAEDQDLYLKMYERGNLLHIPKALYFYRLHGKGVSQEKGKKGKFKTDNWNAVLQDALKRRGIGKLFGKKAEEISSLSNFIWQKENSFFARNIRKYFK